MTTSHPPVLGILSHAVVLNREVSDNVFRSFLSGVEVRVWACRGCYNGTGPGDARASLARRTLNRRVVHCDGQSKLRGIKKEHDCDGRLIAHTDAVWFPCSFCRRSYGCSLWGRSLRGFAYDLDTGSRDLALPHGGPWDDRLVAACVTPGRGAERSDIESARESTAVLRDVAMTLGSRAGLLFCGALAFEHWALHGWMDSLPTPTVDLEVH